MANEGRKHMFHSDANKETDADTQIRIGLGIAAYLLHHSQSRHREPEEQKGWSNHRTLGGKNRKCHEVVAYRPT